MANIGNRRQILSLQLSLREARKEREWNQEIIPQAQRSIRPHQTEANFLFFAWSPVNFLQNRPKKPSGFDRSSASIERCLKIRRMSYARDLIEPLHRIMHVSYPGSAVHSITRLYYRSRYAERVHAMTVSRHILGGVDLRQAPMLAPKTHIKLNRTVAKDRANRRLPTNKLCVCCLVSQWQPIFTLAFPSLRGRKKNSHRRGGKGKKKKSKMK